MMLVTLKSMPWVALLPHSVYIFMKLFFSKNLQSFFTVEPLTQANILVLLQKHF